jgi:DNA excision repair protein ERCC-2
LKPGRKRSNKSSTRSTPAQEVPLAPVVEKPCFTVSVRDLAEFVWRRGDLGGSGDFAGADRALAGTRVHQQWQRSRPAGSRIEVPVSRDTECPELVLRVQGRIDAVRVQGDELVIEELKTVSGRWDGAANPLHWAQARLYSFLCATEAAMEQVQIHLVYLDLDSGRTTAFEQRVTRTDLAAFFDDTLAVYLRWIQELHRWRLVRDASIRSLPFPFACYRPGQRQIAVAAYRTLARGGRLFIEAPTGIGKTAAVVFPALKSLGEGHVDQLFYLTARTVGRLIAERTLDELRSRGLQLRSLTLTAREKICVQDGVPCDTLTCPLACGYYDRRHAAMREALDHGNLTRQVLDTVGRAHRVCPHELSLDLSTWTDAIVCDYNYVFDPKAYLRRHFTGSSRSFAFLIDESHNLVDRARDMFSASLATQPILQVRRLIAQSVPRCARALTRLQRALRQLADPAANTSDEPGASGGEPDLFSTSTTDLPVCAPAAKRGAPAGASDRLGTVLTRRDLPGHLMAPLEAALETMELELARNRPADYRQALLELYFRLHAFRRTAELYDERYATLIEPGSSVQARLFCLDPSFLLRQALDRGKSAVFFSATFTPLDYYQSLLGGRLEDPRLQLRSPFAPEHLRVLLHDRIRTDLKARAGSLDEVVHAIGALVHGRRGNYMIYFSSYQYLGAALDRFQRLYPELLTRSQQPRMTEAERDSFLAAFSSKPAITQVGFAVMGGIFGEGIDLVGDRLIGAAVVGVGLPQLSPERDLIRDHFQAQAGSGFDFAYTFPGMNRVLQAVGRVIRSETDRGIVLLLDSRFSQPRYQRLFPAWWQPVRAPNLEAIRSSVCAFWDSPRCDLPGSGG